MKLPLWRFGLPLLVQVAIPLAVAAPYLTVIAASRTVYLETLPVDPYDPLRGYSQVLGYEFARLEVLQSLPGGKRIGAGSEIYVILAAPNNPNATAPAPWRPVRVSPSLPRDLGPQEIALKGRLEGNRVRYGIEEIYIPENRREQINAAVTQASQKRQALVEVKVGDSGLALVRALWLHGQRYAF
ncbi:MAG: GDYXXLXY domain-containing protein [Gloeomargarita sp. SKYBB_i_bin120]|nr:GDYXXLXY domain-containing protein [Gloeomargarita sp. SKYG98]MCS7293104.1 GDYXXLXY domain-containing protein [Gloeomargarita sp. SKYB120]MDW8178669.1 GDYXXLXY domain-containing protein [Gloeomargarita sp. SKYBB_i_bin120]